MQLVESMHIDLTEVQYNSVTDSFMDTSAPINIWCRSVPDTSVPVRKCLQTLRHWYRNVSRHFGKVWQANSRRIGLRRVHADPRVQDRVQLLRHITPVAQHLSVNVTSGTCRLAGVVTPGLWQRDARWSTRQPARQTAVCDERRCATCLLCAEVRAHHLATP